MPSAALDQLAERFVQELLEGYQPRKIRSPKVIHDALWGTNVFAPYEVAILDSPLLQRLRHTRQTGLACLVYPSAVHSRFEHSAGVTAVVSRLVQKFIERHEHDPAMGDIADLAHDQLPALRVAALLHDCGHGFLSHVSEEIYQWNSRIQEVLSDDAFAHLKPSEILTYHMVKSTAFGDFLKAISELHSTEIDADKIATLVLGREAPERLFLASLINGPVDVDKIDYLSRDSYFTGVASAFDFERLFNEMSVHSFPDGARVIALFSSLPLERLLFAKVALYASVYHHQKVLAADCMVRGIVEYLRQQGKELLGCDFDDPFDFLRVSDYDLLNPHGETQRKDYVGSVMTNLAQRKLLMRCLVLSRRTIDNYDSVAYKLHRLARAPGETLELRRNIYGELPQKHACELQDIWVAIPEQPSLREASQTLVLVGGKPVAADSVFPLEGWLRSYSDNKWGGYVFGPLHLQREVAKAAGRVLEERLGLRLNRLSTELAHIPE